MDGNSPLVAALVAMSQYDLQQVTNTDLATLSASDWDSLPGDVIRNFAVVQMAALSPSTLAALDANTFAQFSRREIANLTSAQIAALNTEEVATMSKHKLAGMSGDQLGAVDPNALAGLGAGRLGSLNSTQIAGLTSAQFDALNPWEIAHVATQDTSGASLARLEAMTAAQFAVLNPDLLNTLGGASLSQISAALFNPDQIGALTSTTIAGLTTAFFSKLSSANLAAISASGLEGVSVADLQALSATQLAGFSQTQMSDMSTAQLAVIGAVDPLILQAIRLEVNGVLTAAGAETILEGVANAGLNATSFAQLQNLESKLLTPDGVGLTGSDDAILTTAATQQFFSNVVSGDAENAVWNGGAVDASALGDLTPTSSQAQFERLIDKWFGGADLPSLQTSAAGDVSSATYAQNNSPLYNASGGPSIGDVLQGDLDDSALLAGIAETVFQDPNYIKQLITDNGDGTYQIEIPNMFGSTFVTVDSELPSGPDGMAAATSATGKWAALLEKAAAQSSVDVANMDGDGAASTLGDSYASLTLNADSQVELYSGQFYSQATFARTDTQSALNTILSGADAAFSHGSNVILDAGDKFYAVTGIDVANGLISVYDPRGGATSTVSAATMATNGDTLYFGVTGRAPT